MRTIGVVSVGRSDYGILRPVISAIGTGGMTPLVFAGGSHLVASKGSTIGEIEADGHEIAARIDMQLAADTPAAAATSMGLGVIGFATAFARVRPDIVLLTGDRTEMLAAACAALPLGIPMAHLHGGEISRGAIDEQSRHAITKMSHLHFCATLAAAARVRQMGEESWRVAVTGAPALDTLGGFVAMDRAALEQRLGIALSEAPLVVTFHPETLDFEGTPSHAEELAAALAAWHGPIVMTQPNADAGHTRVFAPLAALARGRADTVMVDSLGHAAYYSLMRIAAAMVGNSSSGIIEAPSFALPVVNIGERQAGRDRARNVLDVPPARAAIQAAIAEAVSPAFRARLAGMANPYGDGLASARIAERLASTEIGPRLMRKGFADARAAAAVS